MVRKLCSGLRLRGLHKILRLRTMYHLTFSGSCRAGTDRLRWISDRFLLVLPVGPAVFLRWTLRFSVQHQSSGILRLQVYLQNIRSTIIISDSREAVPFPTEMRLILYFAMSFFNVSFAAWIFCGVVGAVG